MPALLLELIALLTTGIAATQTAKKIKAQTELQEQTGQLPSGTGKVSIIKLSLLLIAVGYLIRSLVNYYNSKK